MHYLLFMALGVLALSVESEAAALGRAAASTLPGTPELTVTQPQAGRAETYRSAGLDADGNLTILVADGTIVTIRKEGAQTSFSQPVLSSSRTAVAAQAMFPNCCTSYDIPLQLVVYSAGRVHRFTGANLPIFRWAFLDGGTRVAYAQEPVHFGCAVHYELRDVGSERLLDQVDVPQPCHEGKPVPAPVIPQWVADLLDMTGARR